MIVQYQLQLTFSWVELVFNPADPATNLADYFKIYFIQLKLFIYRPHIIEVYLKF